MCGVKVYEGGWRNNRMHGFGRFVWPDGKTYEGCYEDDQKHGKGISLGPMASSTTACGAVTRCKGIILHPNGTRTESLWEDGKQLNPRN